MEYGQKIISDPDIMLGKPVIKGTRIPAELILRKLSEGMTIPQLLEAYPHLIEADILAVMSYSAEKNYYLSASCAEEIRRRIV